MIKFSPGNCCCVNCTAFLDKFDRETLDLYEEGDPFPVTTFYTAHSGSWSIASEELTTSDSNARLFVYPGYFDVPFFANDFYIDFKASDGDQVLFGDENGFEASNNWVVITVGEAGKIELYDVDLVSPHKVWECDLSLAADEWHTLRVKCGAFLFIDDDYEMRINGSTFRPTVLGTQTISNPVYFDNLKYKMLYPRSFLTEDEEDSFDPIKNCELECGPCSLWYPNGERIALTATVEDAATWNSTTLGQGIFNLERLNGTYVLDEPWGDQWDYCMMSLTGLDIVIREDQDIYSNTFPFDVIGHVSEVRIDKVFATPTGLYFYAVGRDPGSYYGISSTADVTYSFISTSSPGRMYCEGGYHESNDACMHSSMGGACPDELGVAFIDRPELPLPPTPAEFRGGGGLGNFRGGDEQIDFRN